MNSLSLAAVSCGALAYQGWGFLADRKLGLATISVALIVLSLMMLVDSARVVVRERRARGEEAAEEAAAVAGAGSRTE